MVDYIIDTKELNPNGKFWKNFFSDNIYLSISKNLIEKQRYENKEQHAVVVKCKDSNVQVTLFSEKKKEEIDLETKNLFAIYTDSTCPEDSLTLPTSKDLSLLDLQTNYRERPIHCATRYNPETKNIEKIIYQRKKAPPPISAILSFLSCKTSFKRRFTKRYEKRAKKRIEKEGIKNTPEALSVIAEELMKTGKYNADVILMDKRGIKEMPNFENYAFEE